MFAYDISYKTLTIISLVICNKSLSLFSSLRNINHNKFQSVSTKNRTTHLPNTRLKYRLSTYLRQNELTFGQRSFGSCKAALRATRKHWRITRLGPTIPIRIVKRKSELFESLFLFCLKPCPPACRCYRQQSVTRLQNTAHAWLCCWRATMSQHTVLCMQHVTHIYNNQLQSFLSYFILALTDQGFFFLLDEGPSHHSLKAFCATPIIMMKMSSFFYQFLQST
jgi:hypothetical protein